MTWTCIAGIPVSSITPGFHIDQSLNVSAIGSDLQRQQTANYQMVDLISRPINTSGICSSRNTLPLPARPLIQPVDQFQAASQMHSN